MDDLTQTLPRIGGGTPLGSHSLSVLQDLKSYWQELSRANHIPFRSEVDPGRVDAALPYSFILQRVAKGTGRFRVAGAKVEELLGMDPRGMPLTTFFSPAGRVAVQHWFSEVFDRPAIVELPLRSARGMGRPALQGKLLLLPLANEDGDVSMAMGALITEGEVGRAPRRFDVPDGKIQIETVEQPALGAGRVQPTAHAPRMITPRGRPALRLVVDNT